MNIYTCVDHDTHRDHVNGASVIVAEGLGQARHLLQKELRAHGLDAEKPFRLVKLEVELPRATVLCDGQHQGD